MWAASSEIGQQTALADFNVWGIKWRKRRVQAANLVCVQQLAWADRSVTLSMVGSDFGK